MRSEFELDLTASPHLGQGVGNGVLERSKALSVGGLGNASGNYVGQMVQTALGDRLISTSVKYTNMP